MPNYSDQAIQALITTVEATNGSVQELSKSVQALVGSENQRLVKDEHQKEINKKQESINEKNAQQWIEVRETIARSRNIHKLLDGVKLKLAVVSVLAVIAAAGYKF